MSKTLLVFLLSPNVDPYINAIAYSFAKMDVRRVRVIYVKGAEEDIDDSKANPVNTRIWQQIQSLAHGEYLQFPPLNQSVSPSLPLSPMQLSQASSGLDIYRRINEELIDHDLIALNYSNLRNELKSLVKESGINNCVVDVTSASKDLSIDVFSACLALGIRSIHTFALKSKGVKKDPIASLYHSLAPAEYEYVCFTDSPVVKASQDSLLRKSQLFWYVILAAFTIMGVSLYANFTGGSQNIFLEIVNLLATVVGIVTPIAAIVNERIKK